ncbi:MAG TPA: glycosyltransferase, partial [Blastocatellia bacterium]|nr:glycosyltransferase [Blastocatellia bacterium]
MRIGYVLTAFSPLPEAFIRREVLALCDEDHRVFVYADREYYDDEAPEPSHPNLTVRQVPLSNGAAALHRAALEDGVEHLHGSLMSAAHRAAFAAARALRVPFTLRVYSGHDIFTKRDPELYRSASNDQLCAGIVVEDPFMCGWMAEQFGVARDKLAIVPNCFDLDIYRLSEKRTPGERVVILSIARFVQKKGLIYLIEAFNQLCAARQNAELWLVGYGPEENRLQQAASGNERIKFLGRLSEEETRRVYASADIFCLPCVRTANGDADGIPTTILEAMAFELPVVSTKLLSTPCYVAHGRNGLLVPPGDVGSLADALERLCVDRDLREDLGRAGRTDTLETCDIRLQVKRLQQIFIDRRLVDWRLKLAELDRQRLVYTTERQSYYTECRERAANFFRPLKGKVLDIGCGSGKLKSHLGTDAEYFGCDPFSRNVSGAFPFAAARAETLPFNDNSFDMVVFYAVLIHVLDVDSALAEAARVLKPGGHLCLQECYDDMNPIHMNRFSVASLQKRVSEHFNVTRVQPANEYLVMMVAEKPPAVGVDSSSAFQDEERASTQHCNTQASLASICITTYNRAELVRMCVDSALRQTYPNVEVVVVDDGSTDDTRQVLESYGSAIHVEYNDNNRGKAFSKNRALKTSSSEARYVGVLDSDDYYD